MHVVDQVLAVVARTKRSATASATSFPPSAKRVAADDQETLAEQWMEVEASWWATAWPGEALEASAAELAAHSALMQQRCKLHLPRLVRSCLAGAAPGAPLVSAWQLHSAGVAPLLEWCRALEVPEQCTTWGDALARLHARAAVHGDASPAARLLEALACELVSAVAAEGAPPDVLERSSAVLVAYVRSHAEDVLHATPPTPPPDAMHPPALMRGAGLIRAASRAISDVAIRARFVTAQLDSLVARARPDATRLLASIARATEAVAPMDHATALALDALASSLVGSLGERRLAAALLAAAPRDASSATHPGHWLHILLACSRASPPAALAIHDALDHAARGHLEAEETMTSMPPLAAVLLAAHKLLGAVTGGGPAKPHAAADGADAPSTTTTMPTYASWLEALSDSAIRAGSGGGGESGTKRAVSRMVRSLSELVAVQSLDAIRSHLKLSRMLHTTWQAAAPSALVACGLGGYQELLRTLLPLPLVSALPFSPPLVPRCRYTCHRPGRRRGRGRRPRRGRRRREGLGGGAGASRRRPHALRQGGA